MPLLTHDVLKAEIVAAMIAQGLVQREYDSSGKVIVKQPPQVTDAGEKLAEAIATGVANACAKGQAVQSITVVGVTPGLGTVVTPGPLAMP
jgi:preprotein translocase subunit SecF